MDRLEFWTVEEIRKGVGSRTKTLTTQTYNLSIRCLIEYLKAFRVKCSNLLQESAVLCLRPEKAFAVRVKSSGHQKTSDAALCGVRDESTPDYCGF